MVISLEIYNPIVLVLASGVSKSSRWAFGRHLLGASLNSGDTILNCGYLFSSVLTGAFYNQDALNSALDLCFHNKISCHKKIIVGCRK
jgi:hypothetical protein